MTTLDRRKPARPAALRSAPSQAFSARPRAIGAHDVLVALALAGVMLRAICAFKTGWLYDEIVYVDFTGHWFSQHLGIYLFQFAHTHYPPRSPIFADPPLPMILYGAAMHVLAGPHLSDLLAARLVNVAASAFLIVLIYWLARYFFSMQAALIAAGFVAFDPVLVVLGGSAYTETLAALGFYGTLVALVRFRHQPTFARYVALAACFALGMLTKFVVVMAAVPILAVLVVFVRKRRLPWWSIPAFGFVAFAFAAILWAGARDPSQLIGIYRFIFAIRPDTGVLPHFPSGERGVYYLAMAFGTAPAAVAIAWGLCGIRALWLLLVRRFHERELVFTAGFFASLAVLPFLVGYSDHHQLGIALPMGGLLLAGLSDQIAWRLNGTRIVAAGVAILALDTLSLYVTPPVLWGAFNNVLVGRQASRTVYATGAGEGLDLCAKWLNAHTPRDARVGVFAGDWVSRKYLKAGRIAVPAFEWDGPSSLATRGPDYLVVPMTFQPDFERLRPEIGVEKHARFTLVVNGRPYISIYRIHIPVARVGTPALAGAVQWKARLARGVAGRAGADWVRVSAEFGAKGRGGLKPYLAASLPIGALAGTGLQFHLDRAAGLPLYVDLLDPRSGRFLRAILPAEYGRSYMTYVSYASMFEPLQTAPGPALSPNDFYGVPLVLRFATDGSAQHASFEIRDIRFAVATSEPLAGAMRKMARWLDAATHPGDRIAVSAEPWFLQSKMRPDRVVLPLEARDTRPALALQTPRFVVVAERGRGPYEAYGPLEGLIGVRVFTARAARSESNVTAYLPPRVARAVAPVEVERRSVSILNRGSRVARFAVHASGFTLRGTFGPGNGPNTIPYLSVVIPAGRLLGTGLSFHVSRSADVPTYVDILDPRSGRYLRAEIPKRLGQRADPFVAYDEFAELGRASGLTWNDFLGKPVVIRFASDGYRKNLALDISHVNYATL